MIAQAEVAPYLLSLGLLEPRAVVDGELTITDGSHRNRVFVATTRAGPTYVLKQGDPAAHAHEAAVLRSLTAVAALRAHLPAVVDHDATLLLLRTPGGGRDWGVHHAETGFPRLQAASLGRVLGVLHGVAAAPRLPPGYEPVWGVSLPEPPAAMLRGLSAGALGVVTRIQASRELCTRLDALREVCVADGVAHGDLRWENCIALRRRALLIDWELAGIGLRAFDAAGVLAEYLRAWVGSIPIAEPRDPARLLAHAALPLRRMQPAVAAFWSTYVSTCREPPSLLRVIELTAVRLLQTAIERAQGLATPSAHVIALVQVAANLLARPLDAAPVLLGLRE